MKRSSHFYIVALRGFTLVEVLVAMSLLSLVMLALGGTLRSIGQAEERIDQRLARADEMRVSIGFLRATLERPSARKVAVATGSPRPLFDADANALAWIGVMPARYGAGGRHFFRLASEVSGDGPALVIRFAPWVDSARFPDWSQVDSRVLVRGLTRFAVRYQDDRTEPAMWSANWALPDRLPDQVQFDIETVAGPWPPINLRLRPPPASDPAAGGAVFGG